MKHTHLGWITGAYKNQSERKHLEQMNNIFDTFFFTLIHRLSNNIIIKSMPSSHLIIYGMSIKQCCYMLYAICSYIVTTQAKGQSNCINSIQDTTYDKIPDSIANHFSSI